MLIRVRGEGFIGKTNESAVESKLVKLTYFLNGPVRAMILLTN